MPSSPEVEALKLQIEELTRNLTAVTTQLYSFQDESLQRDNHTRLGLDHAWLLFTGILVFWMQGGFALLEAGFVSEKNLTNILFKNIADACVSAIAFYLIGYGLAYGPTTGGVFGHDKFALAHHSDGNVDDYSFWFMQWVFASTSATIVSGSIAERTKFEVYISFSFLMTAVYYPLVAHWIWGHGFMSAWGANPDENGVARPLLTGTAKSNGVIDFAGSGVVHMVGGISGLLGATIVGPRRDRFDPNTGRPLQLSEPNPMLITLGTVILWMGWYAFNAGTSLSVHENSANVSGRIAVNSTMSGAIAGATTMLYHAYFHRRGFQLPMACNGILAGLVSITASCAVVEPWMAILIGFIGAIVYVQSSSWLVRLGIDDPLDASCIHGACGLWGMLAVGFFCTDKNVQFAGYPNVNEACSNGEQIGVQLLAIVALCLWTAITSGGTFLVLNRLVGMRVSADHEMHGLDFVLHQVSTEAPEKVDDDMEGDKPSSPEFLNVVKSPTSGAKVGMQSAGPRATQLSLRSMNPRPPKPSDDILAEPEVKDDVDNFAGTPAPNSRTNSEARVGIEAAQGAEGAKGMSAITESQLPGTHTPVQALEGLDTDP